MSRHALVTGGTGGIGLGIADALLAAGYEVTVTGLSGPEAARLAPRPGLATTVLDVTDHGAVERLFGGLDRLDALVNCAGTIRRGGSEFEIETFREVIEINLTGTMRCCLAARPKLAAAGGGAIVNMASMLSFFGGPLVPAYTASKGGVAQLTKALAVAWAKDGIRVNALAPGWIDTPLTAALVADPARSAAILGRTPAGRWGRPDDLGGAAVFLCSDAARFITGAILPVDGGYAAC
jgi:NAD(P)-dependent dehydrogenase (short-subunit alcohol dehydrogenase family)